VQYGWQKYVMPKIVVQWQRWYRDIVMKGEDTVEIYLCERSSGVGW
jgi:hypothetical protein